MLVNKVKRVAAIMLIMFMVTPYIPTLAVDKNNVNEIMVNTEQEEIAEQNDNESKENDNQGNTKDIITENTTLVEVSEDSENVNLVGEKYSKRKNIAPTRYFALDENIETKTEEDKDMIDLKLQGAETLSLLETKTDAEYEIALAYSDGSYSYVKSANSYEEAVEETEKVKIPKSNETILPAIISKNGQVVYSTVAMGRVWKHINGYPYESNNKNTNLFSDSGLSVTDNYINHGYVEDVPIIIDNGHSAKIAVNGYEGWINKNTALSEFDLVVVPMNQVVNPSYYYAEGGELKHYISSNLVEKKGYAITIGQAPNFFESGVRYYSYDGEYFYKGSSAQDALTKIINDYKANTKNNSVNANNQHVSYYQNLPFRSQTTYSATDLNNFINANTSSDSKLRGTGQAFKDAESKYGVNALLALGVSINESAWGTSTIAKTKNNLFGINAVDSNPGQAANEFATPQDSIYEFAKNYISRGYADPTSWRYNGGFLGNKKFGVNVKYASDPFWGEKASRYAAEGDKYLSGGITKLKDTNYYQLAVAKSDVSVNKINGSNLYNITQNNKGAKYGMPFVITKFNKVTVSDKSSYEIFPERTTSINEGQYHGNYDWNDRGYIDVSKVTLINKGKNVNPIKPPVTIVGGDDRYSTAVELSKSQYTSANTVVIVNGDAMSDGLTATPLASYNKAPLLLTEKNNLPASTKNEITRLKAKKVIIVGGSSVVSSSVESQLKAIGVTSIERLAGSDRYDTSLEVVKYIDKNYYDVTRVFVTYGLGEADALSISPISGREKMPIVLVEKASIQTNIYNWLKGENLDNAYIIGGESVLSNNVLNQMNTITNMNISNSRLGGADRYETNAKVIENFYYDTLDKVFVTKGGELVDALTAGPIAAIVDAPIVLAGSDLTKAQVRVLERKTSNKIVQAGKGVSSTAINTLRTCLEKYE